MNKNEQVVTIVSFSDELRGVAKVDGKTHFVRGALPDERVRLVRTKRNKNWEEGYASEVLHAHPARITPPCAKADVLQDPHPCGGCSLQHMPVSLQRSEKQALVMRLLAHYTGAQNTTTKTTSAAIWQPMIVADELGYRQKARLGVRYNRKANKVHVGFREARSHYIADIAYCPVLDARIGERLLDIADALVRISIPDAIPQIEVALGESDCALVIRHLRALAQTDITILTTLAIQYNWQLWLQPGNYHTAHRIHPQQSTPLLSYQHPDWGVTLAFHPLDFTQVHPEVNCALVTCALNWLALSKQDQVFDLFSGIGNFAVPLATQASHVHAIDSDAMLVARCRANAERNHVHITTHCLNLFGEQDCNTLTTLLQDNAPQAVLVDPPRTGCEQVAGIVAHTHSVTRLLYVSCNPHTLARDAALLTTNGFSISKVAIADMFPHTHHVETICLFTRTS